MKTDRFRFPMFFDVQRLKADLARLHTSDWIDHFVKSNYDGDWSVIPLRGQKNATHPVMQIYSNPSCTEFADTAFLGETPYFSEVLASFQCPLQCVRLMKLSAGSLIKEHCDHALSIEDHVVRMHIPIQTNPEVRFVLNGQRVIMEEGELWYLRLSDPHSVENRGNSSRVHMVIDAEASDWLDSLIPDN